MASQIIAEAVNGPVSAGAASQVADVLVITETGSVSGIGGGTAAAVSLSGAYDAYVYGAVYTVSQWGLRASADNGRPNSLEIGPLGRVSAIEPSGGPNTFSIAIVMGGPDVSLVNHGQIDGATAGVGVGIAITDDTLIDNYGSISGIKRGIWYDTDGDHVVHNRAAGLIDGDAYGIFAGKTFVHLVVDNAGTLIGGDYAIYAAGSLELINTGTIEGSIYPGASATIAATDGAESSKIVNKGTIIATVGDDFAIVLGDAADKVRNKGTIDGMVDLGGGKDKYVGGADKETVVGGNGKDFLKTKSGNDTIDPGAGRDIVRPGAGKDVIIHEVGDGKDKIFGFKPGKDRIDLSDHGYAKFKHLVADMTEKHHKVIVDLAGADRLVLKDVELSDLSHHDFIL